MEGYHVYAIIEEPFLDRAKIGKTKDPRIRIHSLQTGNPNKLIIHRSIEINNVEVMNSIETLLHRLLRDNNIGGEWFAIKLEDIDEIFDLVESIIAAAQKVPAKVGADEAQPGPVVAQPENDEIKEPANRNTCDDCGKRFRTPANLLDHKNRKVPCLIKDVSPAHVNNPNRCAHCNRVFSNIGNLNKHSKQCRFVRK